MTGSSIVGAQPQYNDVNERIKLHLLQLQERLATELFQAKKLRKACGNTQHVEKLELQLVALKEKNELLEGRCKTLERELETTKRQLATVEHTAEVAEVAASAVKQALRNHELQRLHAHESMQNATPAGVEDGPHASKEHKQGKAASRLSRLLEYELELRGLNVAELELDISTDPDEDHSSPEESLESKSPPHSWGSPTTFLKLAQTSPQATPIPSDSSRGSTTADITQLCIIRKNGI